MHEITISLVITIVNKPRQAIDDAAAIMAILDQAGIDYEVKVIA